MLFVVATSLIEMGRVALDGDAFSERRPQPKPRAKPTRRKLAIASLGCFVWLAAGARPIYASEANVEDKPAPESVEEATTALERTFEEEPEKPPLLPRLKNLLRDLPPFLRDTTLQLKPRSYYFLNKDLDNSHREAWALGGSLAYQSGWYRHTLAIGAELFTSQKLMGPESRDGTRLLRPVQQGYTVLGRSYAKLKYRDHLLRLYRDYLDLPYLNKRDSRMTPNTFEAYTVQGRFSREGGAPRFEYVAGYVARIKERDSRTFVPMGEAAGASAKRGLSMAGLRFKPTEHFSLGAINYNVRDVINIFYSEIDYVWLPTEQLGLRFTGQFTDQRSDGDDLLTGSSFDTQLVTGKLAASYAGAVLSVAFSTTDDGARIRSPYGSPPSPLSLMIENFDRAGEDAWGLGLSYHFKGIGLPGLSAFAKYSRGYNARNPDTGLSLADREEVNLTIDYRLQRGRFRGFWIRLRGAYVNEIGTSDEQKQFRVIFNYDIPVL